VAEFLLRQLKYEVGWKSVPIALHCLYKDTRLNCLEISKVCAQHDSMTTDQEDCLLNSFTRNQNAHVLFRSVRADSRRTEIPFHYGKSTRTHLKWEHPSGWNGSEERPIFSLEDGLGFLAKDFEEAVDLLFQNRQISFDRIPHQL
jgi:hypothetical protein